MKTLEIPYLPELETISLEDACLVMEEKAARTAIEVRNWPDQFPYSPITIFDVAYTDEALYLHYFVRGNSLRAVASKDNDDVYKDSCVEFFVRKEDEVKYFNLEFNCIGIAHAGVGEGRHGRSLLDLDTLKRIKRYTTLDPRPFEEIEGLFSWAVLAVVPFDVIDLDKDNLPESIRANVYKCADATALPHFLSWAPIDTPQPDFHRPEFFGRMTFQKK